MTNKRKATVAHLPEALFENLLDLSLDHQLDCRHA